MRMPAGPEWLLLGRTLGVTPVPLGMPEVYLAMKTGTVDGQENPLSILQRGKILRSLRADRAHRAHGAAGVLRRRQAGLGQLNPDQRDALDAAARKTAKAGSDSRLADEKAIVQALKDRGLSVDAVDLAPFRASADRVYAESDLAKAWDSTGMQRVLKA